MSSVIDELPNPGLRFDSYFLTGKPSAFTLEDIPWFEEAVLAASKFTSPKDLGAYLESFPPRERRILAMFLSPYTHVWHALEEGKELLIPLTELGAPPATQDQQDRFYDSLFLLLYQAKQSLGEDALHVILGESHIDPSSAYVSSLVVQIMHRLSTEDILRDFNMGVEAFSAPDLIFEEDGKTKTIPCFESIQAEIEEAEKTGGWLPPRSDTTQVTTHMPRKAFEYVMQLAHRLNIPCQAADEKLRDLLVHLSEFKLTDTYKAHYHRLICPDLWHVPDDIAGSNEVDNKLYLRGHDFEGYSTTERDVEVYRYRREHFQHDYVYLAGYAHLTGHLSKWNIFSDGKEPAIGELFLDVSHLAGLYKYWGVHGSLSSIHLANSAEMPMFSKPLDQLDSLEFAKQQNWMDDLLFDTLPQALWAHLPGGGFASMDAAMDAAVETDKRRGEACMKACLKQRGASPQGLWGNRVNKPSAPTLALS